MNGHYDLYFDVGALYIFFSDLNCETEQLELTAKLFIQGIKYCNLWWRV